MLLRRVLGGAALAVVLVAAGAGSAWAGSSPDGSGGNDGDQHGDHCPVASAEPAGAAPLTAAAGSLLPPPRAPGPIPPLPLPGAPETPDRDPFYRAPKGLPACAPGTVLRSRTVSIIGLTGLTGSPSAYQLLFRSTNAIGRPIAAVTTLLKPTLLAPGPRKVVSYQVFEDSFTMACAPSYTLRTISGLGQPAENALIAVLLANGWDVLVPDHEGPRSVVAIGPEAGRITLDSIRAAENFTSAGLGGAPTPVAMMGYSGGSSPTVWANALAEDYAPELNVVGVVAGGIIANLEGMFRDLANPPFFGAVLGGGIGLDRSYPDFDYDSLLTDMGRAQVERDARDANGCAGFIYNAPLATAPTHTRFADMDRFLAVPRVSKVMRKQNLITGPRFSAPSLFVQGVQDELTRIGQVDDLVAANCRRGATIDYNRLQGDHISTIPIYAAKAIPYLKDRFDGTSAPNTCS